MKQLYYLFFVFLFFSSFRSSAQNNSLQVCGFDQALQKQLSDDPALKSHFDKANIDWKKHVEQISSFRKHSALEMDTVYEIPVVIHVLHTGEAIGTNYNPDDATLEGWIDYVNDIFAADYPGNPKAGEGGTALPIKFTLAKRDPDCNPTNGIVRIDMSGNQDYVDYGMENSGSSGLSVGEVVSTTQWPPGAYYNLYVINKIDGEDGFCSNCSYTAGFAYLGLSPERYKFDGAYMLARIARSGQSTLPHELGHAFGLYHVFQGGDKDNCPVNNDCLVDNDMVCDTDPTKSLLGQCPTDNTINTCTGTSFGVNGVHKNFMGYSNCKTLFTEGQAERMMYMLLTNRQDLINSKGAMPLPEEPVVIATPVAASCNPPTTQFKNNNNVGPCDIFLDSIRYFSNGYSTNSAFPDGNYYIDHTNKCFRAVRTSLVAGNSYDLSVSVRTYPQYVKVYIDYNNDGQLAENELVMNLYSIKKDTTLTISIVPPDTAVQNTPLRMRVMADFSQIPSACSRLVFGQTEDFSVTVLPESVMSLDLISFKGKVSGTDQAELNWEMNPDDKELVAFDLERSMDGEHFKTVKTIQREGNLSSYQAVDRIDNQHSVYFYRIRLIDRDKTFAYSKVIRLTFARSGTQKVSIFPNPVTQKVTVRSDRSMDLIKVLDQNGRVMLQIRGRSGDDHKKILELGNLPRGMYFIQVIDTKGDVFTQKIVKQ